MDKTVFILPRAFLAFYHIKRRHVNTSTSVVVVIVVVIVVIVIVVVMSQTKARTASKAVISIRFNSIV
jgi:hypothetical protein